MTLAYGALATWCGAAIIGGVLTFIAERFGDHLLAASFAPDSRHRRFLKRVSAELLATDVTDEDRARAIDV